MKHKNKAQLAIEEAKFLDLRDTIAKFAKNSVQAVIMEKAKTVEFAILPATEKDAEVTELVNKAVTFAFIITEHIRIGKLAEAVLEETTEFAFSLSF
jgi:hypothetical protein